MSKLPLSLLVANVSVVLVVRAADYVAAVAVVVLLVSSALS